MRPAPCPKPFVPTASPAIAPIPDEPAETRPICCSSNGVGGFSPDGLEYRITIPAAPKARRPPERQGRSPEPAPAGLAAGSLGQRDRQPGSFGFIASEAGSGYSWAGNSQTNRLTPWSNDPVTDPPGEVVYLRDEETGEFWSPTPLPVPSAEPTAVRHGQGYTVYERQGGRASTTP